MCLAYRIWRTAFRHTMRLEKWLRQDQPDPKMLVQGGQLSGKAVFIEREAF